MHSHDQRGVTSRRNHPPGCVDDVESSGPRLDARPAGSMPGLVERDPGQTHVAHLDGRDRQGVGQAPVRGSDSDDLPVGALRQSLQTADRGGGSASRNTMPALFDDSADTTPHLLAGLSRVALFGCTHDRRFGQFDRQGDEHLGVLASLGVDADGPTVLADNVA